MASIKEAQKFDRPTSYLSATRGMSVGKYFLRKRKKSLPKKEMELCVWRSSLALTIATLPSFLLLLLLLLLFLLLLLYHEGPRWETDAIEMEAAGPRPLVTAHEVRRMSRNSMVSNVIKVGLEDEVQSQADDGAEPADPQAAGAAFRARKLSATVDSIEGVRGRAFSLSSTLSRGEDRRVTKRVRSTADVAPVGEPALVPLAVDSSLAVRKSTKRLPPTETAAADGSKANSLKSTAAAANGSKANSLKGASAAGAGTESSKANSLKGASAAAAVAAASPPSPPPPAVDRSTKPGRPSVPPLSLDSPDMLEARPVMAPTTFSFVGFDKRGSPPNDASAQANPGLGLKPAASPRLISPLRSSQNAQGSPDMDEHRLSMQSQATNWGVASMLAPDEQRFSVHSQGTNWGDSAFSPSAKGSPQYLAPQQAAASSFSGLPASVMRLRNLCKSSVALARGERIRVTGQQAAAAPWPVTASASPRSVSQRSNPVTSVSPRSASQRSNSLATAPLRSSSQRSNASSATPGRVINLYPNGYMETSWGDDQMPRYSAGHISQYGSRPSSDSSNASALLRMGAAPLDDDLSELDDLVNQERHTSYVPHTPGVAPEPELYQVLEPSNSKAMYVRLDQAAAGKVSVSQRRFRELEGFHNNNDDYDDEYY